MGKWSLIPHPDFPPGAVEAVQVELDFSTAGVSTIWFTAFGDLDSLVLPPEAQPRRIDGLWKTTCFEMFVRKPSRLSYLEFNFSPSTEWAAYQFEGYRSGMAPAQLAHDPVLSSTKIGWFEQHVTLPLDFTGERHLFQLASIIEETDGSKSYWALKHPPGAPDFHHPDCFVLELPPAV